MDVWNVLLSVIVGSVVLFLWTGLAQNVLPWGVKSVRPHEARDGVGAQIAGVRRNGMIYITDQVAAFIAVKPEAYYSPTRYMALELVTQIGVAAVLTAILVLTRTLPDGERPLLVVLVGAAGIASIDLQYWNWWGFSTRYTLGLAFNRLVGYVLAGFVLLNWLL